MQLNDQSVMGRVYLSYSRVASIFRSRYAINASDTEDLVDTAYLGKISKRLTSMFDGTIVEVHSVKSTEPNAFAMPFCITTTTQYFTWLDNIFLIGPFMHTLFSSIEATIRGGAQMMRSDAPSTFTPGGKANIHIPLVKVFPTTKLITLLDEDELVAILLHEVGHNTVVMQNTIIESAKSVAIGNYFTLIPNAMSANPSMVLPFFVLAMLIATMVSEKYYKRRFEVHADVFAVKMGYGIQLAKALGKMNSWNDEFVNKYIKEHNFNQKKEAEFRRNLEMQMKYDTHLPPAVRDRFIREQERMYRSDVRNGVPIVQPQYANDVEHLWNGVQ